jgi:hypothetical protein
MPENNAKRDTVTGGGKLPLLHSILKARGLAEIGHPRLKSAKPSSFFDWWLSWKVSLTTYFSIRCLTLP